MVRHRYLLPFFIVFVISMVGYSQRGLSLIGGVNLSAPNGGYHFQQNGSVLRRGNTDSVRTYTGIDFGFNASLHCRFSRHWAIESGYQLFEIDQETYDKKFLDRIDYKGADFPDSNLNGVDVSAGNADISKWYQMGYLSAYYFFRVEHRVQPYIHAGIVYNSLLGKQKYFEGAYMYLPTNEVQKINTLYTSSYFSKFVELGLAFHSYSDNNELKTTGLFIGVRYYMAGNVVSGDYQSTRDGVLQYSDHVTASGSYTEVSFRFPLVRIVSAARAKKNHAWVPKAHHGRQKSKAFHPRKTKTKRSAPAPSNKNGDNTRGY